MVKSLRAAGHEVYDFRNPKPGDHGFHWSDIDPNWEQWTVQQFHDAAWCHWLANHGFETDFNAMDGAEVCVLVLPCGRSAHLEAGHMLGSGKRLAILVLDQVEPELMYLMATDICQSVDELISTLDVWAAEDASTESVE